MDKQLQHLLALNVIELSNGKHNDQVIYDIKNGKFTDEEAVSNFDMIKKIIDSGVSVITPIDYKDKLSTLMDHVLFNDNSNEMVEYFASKLTKEDISKLSTDMMRDIYEASSNNSSLLERFFKLDFDFQQGKFNEVDRAMSGNIEFFELCMQMKPDFKFSFKYEDGLTLDEILFEDIESCKNSNYQDPSLKKRECLLLFLKKARESEELKDNLESQLPNSTKNNYQPKKI
jgi:hypothetical protein